MPTPLNTAIFIAAYSGAISGMGVGNRLPTSNLPSTYAGLCQAAGAFASAVDTAFSSASHTGLDTGLLQSIAEAIWTSRTPQYSGIYLLPETYVREAEALVAILNASDIYFNDNYIEKETSTGGGGEHTNGGTAVSLNSSTTVDITKDYYFVQTPYDPVTLTLPTPTMSDNSRRIRFIHTGVGVASFTISGGGVDITVKPNEAAEVVAVNTVWKLVSQYLPTQPFIYKDIVSFFSTNTIGSPRPGKAFDEVQLLTNAASGAFTLTLPWMDPAIAEHYGHRLLITDTGRMAATRNVTIRGYPNPGTPGDMTTTHPTQRFPDSPIVIDTDGGGIELEWAPHESGSGYKWTIIRRF